MNIYINRDKFFISITNENSQNSTYFWFSSLLCLSHIQTVPSQIPVRQTLDTTNPRKANTRHNKPSTYRQTLDRETLNKTNTTQANTRHNKP